MPLNLYDTARGEGAQALLDAVFDATELAAGISYIRRGRLLLCVCLLFLLLAGIAKRSLTFVMPLVERKSLLLFDFVALVQRLLLLSLSFMMPLVEFLALVVCHWYVEGSACSCIFLPLGQQR